MGSIPSTKNANLNNQCTGRISRQLLVEAPTLSTGSSLSPSQGRLRPKIKYDVSFLPIVLLKMRYKNVKLQMRLNQGPNDDGHEMNKIQ